MERAAAQPSVTRLLAQASDRGERIVSASRSVFVGASLVRTLLLHASGEGDSGVLSARFSLAAASAVIVLTASAWFVFRPKGKLAPEWTIWASIALDAVTVFVSLLSNVLWPWEDYPGLLAIPDFAALLLVIAVAGFRFLPRAALAGGALNLCGLFALLYADQHISGASLRYGMSQVVMVTILAIATVTLSYFSALRTRRLVQQTALESLRAQQSNAHLVRLLGDQHDAKNIAASTLLLSEWVAKNAAKSGAGEVEEIALKLHRDVKRFADLVSSPAKAFQYELAKQNAPEPTPTSGVFEDIFSQLKQQYPVEFNAGAAGRDERVWLVGGEVSLRRVFFNVLLNCCQGNGRQGASKVNISRRREKEHVVFLVEDDGPGFDHQVGGSTKAGGWGVGLELVATLVSASGGTFKWGDRSHASGAFFEFRFLAA